MYRMQARAKFCSPWILLLAMSWGCSTPGLAPSFFEESESSLREPAESKSEEEHFYQNFSITPSVQDLDAWNSVSDDQLHQAFESYHERRRLRPEVRQALKKSLHCGNLRCEANYEENSKSCPLDCGRLKAANSVHSISSFNMGTQCDQVKRVWEPTTLDEAKALIKKLTSSGTKKIRFVGTRHSASSVICSEDQIILTTRLNRILKIDESNRQAPAVEVESGALLGEVWEAVAKKGYSLGFGYPFLRAATIGGMLTTGSHGSAHGRYGVASQNIESLTLIRADGSELTLTPADGDRFRAAAVSVGSMGLISKFRLRIEPNFNLKAGISDFDTARFIDRKNQKLQWGLSCDFDTIAWFFGSQKAIKICWNKTQESPTPGAENVMLVHDASGLKGKLAKYLLHYGKVYPWMTDFVTKLRYEQVMKDSVFIQRDPSGKEIRAKSVVGPSQMLLLSQHRGETLKLFNIHDLSFAIEEQKSYEALAFLDDYAKKHRLTMPLTGVMLRFTESDGSSFLSHIEQNGPGKRYVMLDFFEYRYFNMKPEIQDRLNQGRIELFKALISQFGAVPHPAKNDDWIFQYAIEKGVYSKDLYSRYFKVRDAIDPQRIFMNAYFERFRDIP